MLHNQLPWTTRQQVQSLFSSPLKMSLKNPSRLGVFKSDVTFKESVLIIAVKAAKDALSNTLDTGENTLLQKYHKCPIIPTKYYFIDRMRGIVKQNCTSRLMQDQNELTYSSKTLQPYTSTQTACMYKRSTLLYAKLSLHFTNT